MLETKEQKQIFFGCLALVLIILGFSYFNSDRYKPKPVVENLASNEVFNSKAYLEYFAAANVDKKASQDLLQTIITEEDIKKEVEKDLAVDQKITPPALDESKIKVVNKNTEQDINNYLSSTISEVYAFNGEVKSPSENLFGGGVSNSEKIKPAVTGLTSKLYEIEVPKEAESMHKALITAYTAYDNLVETSKQFNQDFSQNQNLWPEVYKDYAIANNSAKVYTEELNKIASKYSIAYVDVKIKYASNTADTRPMAMQILIPEANAFLGLSFSFTVADIPRIIMDAVKEGLRSAFLQFMGAMLNKLVAKIEQSYAISNFLYYTDALVNGQYVDDYLNKYVQDQLDKTIIKKLIPQINCGNNPNLKQLFLAQANQYLGYNPATLNVNDPDYYSKMAKAGDFLASPSGWQQYYEGLAAKAQSQAQKAAEQELTSPGLKTPRSTIKSTISSSINSIISAERASLTAVLQLGINNAESIISGVVAQLTQTLVNRFVFQGVVSSGGSIAVYKEQATCFAVPVVDPVLPVPPTEYQQPKSPPTAQAVVAAQCSSLTEVSDNCTNAVLAELKICAQTPSAYTGTITCSDLANSNYINAKLALCRQEIRRTQDCVELQSLLQVVK